MALYGAYYCFNSKEHDLTKRTRNKDKTRVFFPELALKERAQLVVKFAI